MQNIVDKVVHELGFNGQEVVKAKHGNCLAITSKQFIEAILRSDNTPSAANHLNIGEQTLNRIISRVLLPVFGKLNGGNETWKYVLLKNAELKECHTCGTIGSRDIFTKHASTSDGLDRLCKDCKSIRNTAYYSDNKDRYHKAYIAEHREEYNARNAKRRAAKLQRTPLWANLDKIKDFYLKCPEGYQVDHIVPLQGTNVSGFHVENNLQYLTAEDNLKKGNRFGGLVELADTPVLSTDASA